VARACAAAGSSGWPSQPITVTVACTVAVMPAGLRDRSREVLVVGA